MSFTKLILALAATGLSGVVLGYILRWLVTLSQKGSIELTIKQTLLEAKTEASKRIDDAEKEAERITKEAKEKEKETRAELKKKEDHLIKKDETLDKRQQDIEREVEGIKQKIEEVKSIRERVDALAREREEKLAQTAGISREEARNELMTAVEHEAEEDLSVRVHKLEQQAQDTLERRAKDILATIIQRLASASTPEIMSTNVSIPSDDVKGKIIGKEGRNIRTFERSAGVELVVDDTPGAITISSFDPVRRHIAKVALENLIADGRIQPAKIEETVEKARGTINKIIKERGEAAAYEAGVLNLDQRVLMILGRLHFRTSYGQNVLQHSIEMAHLAGMLAEELGADVSVSKAGALLHDIGKAIDHEVPGTHVEIGIRILEKFGVSEAIIKAMRSHHEEYPYETIESIIVQIADSISGGRPGARRDSVENFLKRLADLETIANSFPGIDKSYAIQAGREVRVFVTPEKISDMEARKMARDMALRIEKELKYPGEIKITVIRESRVIEYAR